MADLTDPIPPLEHDLRRTAAEELDARQSRNVAASVLAYVALDPSGNLLPMDRIEIPDDNALAFLTIGAEGVAQNPEVSRPTHAVDVAVAGFHEARSVLQTYELNHSRYVAANKQQERSRRRMRAALGSSAVAGLVGLAMIPTHSAAVFAPAELMLIGSTLPAAQYYDCKHKAAVFARRASASLGVVKHMVAPIVRERQQPAAPNAIQD